MNAIAREGNMRVAKPISEKATGRIFHNLPSGVMIEVRNTYYGNTAVAMSSACSYIPGLNVVETADGLEWVQIHAMAPVATVSDL